MWQEVLGAVAKGLKGASDSAQKAKIGESGTVENKQTSNETSDTQTEKIDSKPNIDNLSSLISGSKGLNIGSDIGASASSVGGAEMATAEGAELAESAELASVASDKKTKNAKDVSTNTKSKEETKEKWKDGMSKAGKALADSSEKIGNSLVDGSVYSFTPISSQVVSDERLKDIFGEETPIDCFAKIHSYEFKYTPEAQEMLEGKNHVDDKEHLGVMAQELLANPATSACVIKDTDGFLKVDTAQLTMANTATIAELSRKIQKLEELIGER